MSWALVEVGELGATSLSGICHCLARPIKIGLAKPIINLFIYLYVDEF